MTVPPAGVLAAIDAAGCSLAEVEDAAAADEEFAARRWSDGLPIVAPTVPLVEATVAAGGRPPDEVVGEIPARGRRLTVLQAAVCAVAAGAPPDCFPIVLASWDAVLDPAFNAHAVLTSSGGPALTTVVSGPYGAAVGMNSGRGLFGPGNRANATIGRALRLGAVAALGAEVGALDASSFGHAGRYTSHFLESEPPAPWLPLRRRLGFGAADTTVTVIAADAPRQVHHNARGSGEDLLRVLVNALRDPSHIGTGKGTTYLVVLGPEHAGVLVAAGLTQESVCEYLATGSRQSVTALAAAGVAYRERAFFGTAPAADGTLPTVRPEDVVLVTAGGPGAGWSSVVPCWATTRQTVAVTRPVRLEGG